MAEPNDNKELRGPVNLRIKFRSASLQQFIERYGVDVSRGGIFIRTREPLPVGTRLKLDFQLVDSAPLFQGDGTVVWIREYDPGKVGVTPGMGVRFDRLTPESQPTLDKILDEKMRLQQTGVAPGGASTAGAGLAVRRPSGAITALDVKTAKQPPPPPAAAVEVKMDPLPVGAAPVTTMPASQSRSGPIASSGGGIFSRPRTTSGMSTLRSTQAGAAMFEQPTAADIDKALSALEEKGPTPSMPVAPPPPPPPISVAPAAASMGDDEPTKVFDVAAQEFAVHEAVTGQTSAFPDDSGVPVATGGDDLTAKQREVEPSEPVPAVAQSAPGSGRALDAPLAAHLDGTAPAATPLMTPAAAAREAAAVPKRIAVDQPGRAIESGRFRSDAKYKRSSRKTGKIVVAVLLAGAAAAGVVLGKREYDKRKAASIAMAPVPAPAETAPPGPPPAPPAPDNAGVAPTAPVVPPTEAKAPTPPVAAPDKAPEIAAVPAKSEKADKPAKAGEKLAEDRPSKSGRRRREAATSEAGAVGSPDKVDKPVAPVGEKPAPAEAATGTAPAGTAEAPKPAEAAPTEKPLLKVTSSPTGAEVVIDGSTVGTTPFSSKEIDPTAAHAITVRKDGFEAHERMISASDWNKSRSGAQSLKMSIKLKRSGPSEAPAKDESGGKASDVEILTPSEP